VDEDVEEIPASRRYHTDILYGNTAENHGQKVTRRRFDSATTSRSTACIQVFEFRGREGRLPPASTD